MALPVEPDASMPVTLIGCCGVVSNRDRQVQCANRFDPAFRDAMWAEGLQADGVACERAREVRLEAAAN
jgi:hypothetical protein